MINYSTNQFKRKGFPHIFGDIFINVLLYYKELWKKAYYFKGKGKRRGRKPFYKKGPLVKGGCHAFKNRCVTGGFFYNLPVF